MVAGICHRLFADKSLYGRTVHDYIRTKAGKFAAKSNLIDKIYDAEAKENDLKQDVNQDAWIETAKELIDSQAYSAGVHPGRPQDR